MVTRGIEIECKMELLPVRATAQYMRFNAIFVYVLIWRARYCSVWHITINSFASAHPELRCAWLV